MYIWIDRYITVFCARLKYSGRVCFCLLTCYVRMGIVCAHVCMYVLDVFVTPILFKANVKWKADGHREGKAQQSWMIVGKIIIKWKLSRHALKNGKNDITKKLNFGKLIYPYRWHCLK